MSSAYHKGAATVTLQSVQGTTGESRVFEAVWEVLTRRTYDRALAASDLGVRMLHAEGELRRENDRLLVGNRELNKDRELLPMLARGSGLGFAVYLGNLRVATATVLDAGTAPELGGFAPPPLVDTVLRRRQLFRGEIDYAGRRYIVVARPLHASEGQEYAPIGMLECFQDEQAFFDLLSAAARSGFEDQIAEMESRADNMDAIISFIDDIARRLQLLALNGNIIAAQAGEHGRAFRVVCRELGGLADQAKTTGGEVRKLVSAMGLDQRADDDAFVEPDEPPTPPPTAEADAAETA
jgi:hypothetical protein